MILGNCHCLFHDERDKRIVKIKTDLWDSSIKGNKETKNHENKSHRLANICCTGSSECQTCLICESSSVSLYSVINFFADFDVSVHMWIILFVTDNNWWKWECTLDSKKNAKQITRTKKWIGEKLTAPLFGFSWSEYNWEHRKKIAKSVENKPQLWASYFYDKNSTAKSLIVYMLSMSMCQEHIFLLITIIACVDAVVLSISRWSPQGVD